MTRHTHNFIINDVDDDSCLTRDLKIFFFKDFFFSFPTLSINTLCIEKKKTEFTIMFSISIMMLMVFDRFVCFFILPLRLHTHRTHNFIFACRYYSSDSQFLLLLLLSLLVNKSSNDKDLKTSRKKSFYFSYGC